MMASPYYGVSNTALIEVMFRPLYWFGVGYTPDVNRGLSVADPPVYSDGGRTVTIKMKGYKWSNGKTVDARDVPVLDQHGQGERHLVGRLHIRAGRVPRRRHQRRRERQHRHGHAQSGRGLRLVLVHLQRAQPDHAPADRLGHHLGLRSSGLGGLLERHVRVGSGSISRPPVR